MTARGVWVASGRRAEAIIGEPNAAPPGHPRPAHVHGFSA